MVQGRGFRAEGSGFRVSELTVEGLGFYVNSDSRLDLGPRRPKCPGEGCLGPGFSL